MKVRTTFYFIYLYIFIETQSIFRKILLVMPSRNLFQRNYSTTVMDAEDFNGYLRHRQVFTMLMSSDKALPNLYHLLIIYLIKKN